LEAGAGLGFLLWFTGFMVIGGEWFAMWQSKEWNGVPSAFRFDVILLLVLIFVMQKDADDLLANFVRVMHSDPEDATFTEFVRWYLPAKYADPHVWAQSDHLLPVDYNCAWSMAWLQDHAREIFGREIADRYFLMPANQSSEHLFNDPSEDVPVRELRQHYDRTGELPGVRALRNNETSRMIHDLYERDYELESSVQKSEPALA